MEDSTNTNYKKAKRIRKDFEKRSLGEYHYLYVPGDTLLLADIFNNFQNIYFEIYGFDSAYFFSAQASSLKRTKRKSDLLTDIDMLLIAEKGIRGGVCLAIHQYTKDFDKK